MFKQPFVFRLYFTNESDAKAAQRQLGSEDIRPDYIKAFGQDEPAKWKMIFAEPSMLKALNALKSLSAKPVQVDYFDPQSAWTEEFKPVVLDS